MGLRLAPPTCSARWRRALAGMVLETPSEDFARGEADTVKARGQPLVCNGKARPRKAYDRQKILATPMAGIPGGERLGRDTRFVKSIARSPLPGSRLRLRMRVGTRWTRRPGVRSRHGLSAARSGVAGPLVQAMLFLREVRRSSGLCVRACRPMAWRWPSSHGRGKPKNLLGQPAVTEEGNRRTSSGEVLEQGESYGGFREAPIGDGPR